jgi:hypothetical protein
LQHKYGRTGPSSIADVKKHWTNKGFSKGKYADQDFDQPVFCGDTPGSTCKCPGVVWLGYKFANDTGARLDTWESFKQWKHVGKSDPSAFIGCNKRDFGKDPTNGEET